MRITGGQFRSRALVAPRGNRTRPTSDRVREALFSVLSAENALSEESAVLDLYAGTGALAFESLSRGAARATLVEVGPDALLSIAANAKSLGVSDQIEVLRGRADAQLGKLNTRAPFGVIFVDPPYVEVREPGFQRLLVSVGALLSAAGVLVLEHASSDAAPEVEGLTARPTRIYGDTALTLYDLAHASAGS